MANERILIVDDEKGVVRSCVRILQKQGFSVQGRTESESVPELLRRESFDLLLTDIRMPKIDGLKLLQIAREIDPHLSVVLITGFGTMEDAVNAIRLGAQGFIMKPFDPEDLVGTVRDNLARRAMLRDSLRLQTLLPLLELNQVLQPEGRQAGGEAWLARRALEIASRETGAVRIAWLSRGGPADPLRRPARGARVYPGAGLAEQVVVPVGAPPSGLPGEALAAALAQARPVWVLAGDRLVDSFENQASVTGAVLPLIVKAETVGLITAETAGPFNQISLDLLAVLAGQLAIALENVQLFQQTETLLAFNEDVIEHMTNGLVAVDRELRVTVLNPAAAAMLGCSTDESLDQPLAALLPGGTELVELFGQTLASGRQAGHRELNLAHPDGTRLPVGASAAPLFTRGAAEPVGVVGVLEDLSEIKALEAERRRLDRLALLGEMSAVVAHEIRNPIAGIAAGIEYFTRHVPPDSAEYEGVGMIRGEIERVNRILEDILFVARPMRLRLAPENLAEILDSVVQRCAAQLQEGGVEVSRAYAANLPPLPVDRQRLEQVLTNLVINAIQAMRGGGRLILRAEPGQAGGAVLTVADTGPGISPDLQPRIFEPFFTTKSRGTGLGLTVARRIVEEHGGSLSVTSAEGQGTRFVIRLPGQRDQE